MLHLGRFQLITLVIVFTAVSVSCGRGSDDPTRTIESSPTSGLATNTTEPVQQSSPTLQPTATVASNPSGTSPTIAPTETALIVEEGVIFAPVADISVDGDATDWDAIDGQELTLLPVLNFDVPTQTVMVKVAHDAEFVYLLLLVDDDYHWNSTNYHLVVSPAVMWAIDADAGPHMGTDGQNIMTSLGMVDLWHWEISCAAGEEQGGAVNAPGEGMDPGNDGTCHFDDEWTTTPFEREDDNGEGAENSLLGIWTHSNPVDGGDGIYVFEIRRPLITGDTQDAQFVTGESSQLAIAYWDPDGNLRESEDGWEEAQHVQSADQGWIEVLFE